MKAYRPTQTLVDVGEPQGCLRLPTAGRIRAGMKTTCARCRKAITDEYFIGAIGGTLPKNMLLHESCAKKEGLTWKEEP